MLTRVVIDERYCGPPNSGNGGYSCGVIGETIDGPSSVTLRRPPPLETEMTLDSDGMQARLLFNGDLVGDAERTAMDIAVPPAPSLDQAHDASSRYQGYSNHPFSTCFVCGPERSEGDGLRIFPGSVHDTPDLVAAPWTPFRGLADSSVAVGSRYVWSALDCPSYFAFPGMQLALLGRLKVEIISRPEVGQDLVVYAWPRERAGRKLFSGSAIADKSGRVLAVADALWITIDSIPT